jgi:hypothetical protein
MRWTGVWHTGHGLLKRACIPIVGRRGSDLGLEARVDVGAEGIDQPLKHTAAAVLQHLHFIVD